MSKENPHLSISELSSICGISLRTLRFYEDIRLLQPLRVGNQRLYSSKDKIRVELILKGKRLGFSLSEIRELIAACQNGVDTEPSTDLVRSLGTEQISAQIRHLEQQRKALEIALGELRSMVAQKVSAHGV